MKTNVKPKWIKKPINKNESKSYTFWIYGIHAVSQALENSNRKKFQLQVTPNGLNKISNSLEFSQMIPQIIDPRKFKPPIDKQSIHQGVVLEVAPLKWESLSETCAPNKQIPVVILLDRVTDPHNVGAIIRTAQALGVRAVIAPQRYSAPETGALAKSASGALESLPYLQVPNLARAMRALKEMGYLLVGLDQDSNVDLSEIYARKEIDPIAFILGSEGSGLRDLTKRLCDVIVTIRSAMNFGSLNVSNAAAIALFTAKEHLK